MSHGLRVMGVDEFLAYDPRSRSEFLGAEWKKRGFLNAWLHRRLPFATNWQHGIPRIDVRDDPETRQPQRKVFSGNYKCIEDESVLRDQYKRDRDTGERKNPPQVCPNCLLVEHVHMLVIRGEMHWLEGIFDFDVGDPMTRVYLRASGMWNGYKPDRLNDTQKAEMSEAGISPMYGWKENLQASLKYVMCVVDADAPNKGIQLMKESQALGDKVRVAIAKEMRRNPRNPKLGDPVQNPYAFTFTYDEKASPDKKYDAMRVDIPLDEVVNQLISGTEAPDVSMLAGNYSPLTLRAQLERACLVDLPWDSFFTQEAIDIIGEQEDAKKTPAPVSRVAPPRAAQAAVPTQWAPSTPTAALQQAGPPGRPLIAAAPARVPQRAAPLPPPPVEDAQMFACDACGQAINATDTLCPYCGATYEVAQEAAQPPPPSLPKRSSLPRAQPAAVSALPPRAPSTVPSMRGQRVVPAAPHAVAPARQVVAGAPQGFAHARPAVAPAPRSIAQPPREPQMIDARDSEVPGGEPGDPVGFGDFGDDEIPF